MESNTLKRGTAAIFFLFCASGLAFGQDADAAGRNAGATGRASAGIDLNEYYRYPFSAAGFYQSLSGLGDKELADFSINEISGELRLPLPKIPVLQPLLRIGVITWSYLGDENQDWTHTHVYAAPGIGYVTRISREFELGGDLFAGFTQSYFNKLVVDGVVTEMGQLNFIAGASGRLALNPSYNISISVHPAIRYNGAFGELRDYNGFTFGVGFSVSYRFGQDPDAAQSTIRALRFGNINLPPLFAAMRSYYSNNPAGSFTITNTEKYTVDDISVSFMQAGFMDFPTPLVQGASLAPGESLDLSFVATFNDQVFSTEGITPLTGELTVQYRARGRSVEQKQSVSYDLYDRNAITWDDDRKVAAFITPQDSAIRNYTSFISQAHRDLTRPGLSKNLQFAMQAFNALGVIGILYQIDPTAPFATMQGNTKAVDSISLPRETLKRLTGDCDDLTALYCTILETVGIDTAIITTPAHIFCAFNTGVASADYRFVCPDRGRLIESDGEIWIPVEITMIGKADFFSAWDRGLSEFAEYADDPGQRGFYKTKEAQTVFRPVSLRETDLGLQYGEESAVTAQFKQDIRRLGDLVMGPYRTAAETENTPAAWNTLGITAANLGDYTLAGEAFKKALKIDPTYLSAQFNLANLFTLEGDHAAALAAYRRAEEQASAVDSRVSEANRFRIYIGIAKSELALGNTDAAKAAYAKAVELDPEKAADYAYLGGDGE
ncbi:MAG: tetratricopeptide repeat protein [Spirochaetales bacterium]|nr:tetratricopeptide repeat protein [Spirochaetales bacterium]